MREPIVLWAILTAAAPGAAACGAETGSGGPESGAVPFGGVYHAASDGWDIQATSVDTAGATLSGLLPVPVMPKGTFLQVGVALTNTGKSAHALGKNRFSVHDAADRSYEAQAFSNPSNPLDDLTFGEDVPPGTTLKGLLSFDVPKDLKGPLLEVIGGGRMDLGGDVVAGRFVRSGGAGAAARPGGQGQPPQAQAAATATRTTVSAPAPGATATNTKTGTSPTTAGGPTTTVWTVGQAPPAATATRVPPTPTMTVPPTPTMTVPTRTPTPSPTPTTSDWSPLMLMPVGITMSADGRNATVTIRNFSSQTGFRGWLDICVGVSDCWPSGAQVDSLPAGGTATVILGGLAFPSATANLLRVEIDGGHKLVGAYAGLHRQRLWLNGSGRGPEVVSAAVRRDAGAGNVKLVVRNLGPDFNGLDVQMCAVTGPEDRQDARRSNRVQASIGAGRTEVLTFDSAIWAKRAVVWLCDGFGYMLGPATSVAMDQP